MKDKLHKIFRENLENQLVTIEHLKSLKKIYNLLLIIVLILSMSGYSLLDDISAIYTILIMITISIIGIHSYYKTEELNRVISKNDIVTNNMFNLVYKEKYERWYDSKYEEGYKPLQNEIGGIETEKIVNKIYGNTLYHSVVFEDLKEQPKALRYWTDEMVKKVDSKGSKNIENVYEMSIYWATSKYLLYPRIKEEIRKKKIKRYAVIIILLVLMITILINIK